MTINVAVPLFAISGDAWTDYLTDYWHEANARWFRGKLTPVPIVAGLNDSRKTLGTYGYDTRKQRTQITVNWRLLRDLNDPLDYLNATNTVLHEMVHQYLCQCVDWRLNGHGPEFAEVCNKIAAKRGMPEVYARKPRGRTVPLARYWPSYVSPAKAGAA